MRTLREPAARQPLVGAWLIAVCALVAAMVLVGGATRLTDSGLSITEWNFTKQVIPPLSDAAWRTEFELYRSTTEYQIQNRGMSMPEFQYIYWWEWGHRFLGKFVGVVFALPFLFFWATGRLRGRFWPILGLFALGGLQGYVGWWMVESGLVGRLDVAPYRLATHLGLAFLIFAVSLRLALDAFQVPRSRGGASVWPAAGFAALLFVQILSGALVAGNDAGKAFADWPTIGGDWFPAAYWADAPAWRNLMENHAAVQFNHRTLGYLAALAALAVAVFAWRAGGAARRLGAAVGGVAFAQMCLGVVTVIHAAPLGLSLIHQALALSLWGLAIALVACVGGAKGLGKHAVNGYAAE